MPHTVLKDTVVNRLSALWALTEITLGGVLHALRIPLTGLFVGSTALACVYLIAISSKHYRSIVKSLSVVSAIKVMSTPHASPFSYLAMAAQSLCCMPLAGRRGQSRIWVTVMFLLASIYSPMQKLMILYVTLGQHGLSAVLVELRDWVAPNLTTTEFVMVPLLLWFGAHLSAGFFLAKWLHRWAIAGSTHSELYDEWNRTELGTPVLAPSRASRRRQIAFSAVTVAALSLLYVFEGYLPGWVHVLWRPLLIIACWQLMARPLLMILSKYWTRSTIDESDVRAVMDEFPRMWSILTFAQKKSIHATGWTSRMRTFLMVTMHISLTPSSEAMND